MYKYQNIDYQTPRAPLGVYKALIYHKTMSRTLIMYISIHPDIIPFKECEIIIFKGHQVLGIIITGGTDSLLDGIYIQKIIPGSPADKDGRLKPGDKILRINNSSMEGVPRDEALRALQHSASFVHITIVRDPNSAPTMPPYKEEGVCVCVCVCVRV